MSTHVTLVGNITSDPQLRFLPSGQAMATFGLAVNRRWQNRQTQAWEEETSFFDVVAWASLAENVVESITKGTRVVVTGRLSQRSWENDAGEKRSKVEVVADEVAPSLRWATAVVTRVDKGATSARPTPQESPAPRQEYQDFDEEPFVRDAGEWMPGAWGSYPESARP